MPYARLTANGTTPVKYSGATKLNKIIINTKGASSNTLTVRDGAADGIIVAVIDTTTSIGTINFGDVLLKYGLTLVSATGTAPDVTVIYDEF